MAPSVGLFEPLLELVVNLDWKGAGQDLFGGLEQEDKW